MLDFYSRLLVRPILISSSFTFKKIHRDSSIVSEISLYIVHNNEIVTVKNNLDLESANRNHINEKVVNLSCACKIHEKCFRLRSFICFCFNSFLSRREKN
jgi:hypothetical protein